MKVIKPIPIGTAQLVSSNAVEVAPALYAVGTTYAAGAQVSTAGPLGARTVWASLQDGNVGHAPAAGSVWWAKVGDTYQSYASGSTYALGERVLDPVSHKVYESLVASNTGQALTDKTKWLYVSYSNRMAMFDYTKNTATSRVDYLRVEMVPGGRVGAVSLHGLMGKSATISVYYQNQLVFSKTFNLSLRTVSTYREYCFSPFATRENVVQFDLPPYSGATVIVEVTARPGALAQCRACVVGVQEYLGAVQYEAESDVLNFSTVDRTFDGFVDTSTLQQRRNVPKTIQQIWLDKSLVRRAFALRNELNGTPAVWSALGDANDDGYFDALLILGFYKRFTINTKAPTYAVLSLELEEI